MSGCSNTPEIVKIPSCDGFSIIWVSVNDKMTLDTKKQILAHNEFYDSHCTDGGDLESSNPQ